MASAWVGGGVMRIFAGSARNSWSRGRAVPPIAGQACLGLGSRAGSGMASAELNSDLDFGARWILPINRVRRMIVILCNHLRWGQTPSAERDVDGRPGRDRIKAPACRFVVSQARGSGTGRPAPPAKMCGLRCVNSLKCAEKFHEFP